MARRWIRQWVYRDDPRDIEVTVTEWDGGGFAYFVEANVSDYEMRVQVHEQYDPPFDTAEQAIEAVERWLDEKYGGEEGK